MNPNLKEVSAKRNRTEQVIVESSKSAVHSISPLNLGNSTEVRGTGTSPPDTPKNFLNHLNLNNSHNQQSNCFGNGFEEGLEDEGHGEEIASKLWDYAYQMLLSQKHCDVLITTQKGSVKAHRCILAFHSSYLNDIFQQLGPEKKVIIRLDTIPIDTVRQMLCFFYSGEIKVTKFNLVDLLNIAEQYCFSGLQNACLDFFKDITPENAIFLLSLTNSMGLDQMQKSVIRFIIQTFGQVSQTPDFVYLPLNLLMCILSDDDLQVYKELDAFYAVVRWIEYKKDQRICHVAELLNGPVRLELMSVDELSDEVESQDWLFVTQEAKDMLSEAYRKKLLMSTGYYPSCCVRQRNNASCQF